jgi:hypothetical protein
VESDTWKVAAWSALATAKCCNKFLCRKTKTTLQPQCYCNCCCHPTFLSWKFTPWITHFHHHHHHPSSSWFFM